MINKVEICGVNTSKLKVLKEAEKIELLRRIKAGDRDARTQLVNGNLRLVLSVVQKFTNRGENLDDLFQVGCIGLIKSIDNFDIALNVRFSTYAVPMNRLSRKETERMKNMTRKQALMQVCEILNTYEQTLEVQEIQAKVLEVISELPFTAWSESTIFDTIDQWIFENGRIPNTRDLTRKGLPPIPVIKNRFKMLAREFLDTYYPQSKLLCQSHRYGHKTKDEWISDFKIQYKSLNPKSASDYNKHRCQNSPTWVTIAKMFGLKNWNELLVYCGLPSPKHVYYTGRKSSLSKSNISINREVDVDKILSNI